MTRLRIATYNIHGCVGIDGRRDVDRVVSVLSELDVAAVGLQEVDSRRQPDPPSGQMVTLARGLGMTAVPGHTILQPTGTYGNALLTGLPVAKVNRYDLSVSRREPRGAVAVTLLTRSGPVDMVVTHLGLARSERFQQLERLDAIASRATGPLVVMGDFNEWTRWRLRRMRFAAHGGRSPRTYPSWLPILALDRVFTRPAAVLESIECHTPARRGASDHLPLVATIAL